MISTQFENIQWLSPRKIFPDLNRLQIVLYFPLYPINLRAKTYNSTKYCEDATNTVQSDIADFRCKYGPFSWLLLAGCFLRIMNYKFVFCLSSRSTVCSHNYSINMLQKNVCSLNTLKFRRWYWLFILLHDFGISCVCLVSGFS